jgi:hypothetical protein
MADYYRHHGYGSAPRLTTKHKSLLSAKRWGPGYVWAESGDGGTWYGYDSRADMKRDEYGGAPLLVRTRIQLDPAD